MGPPCKYPPRPCASRRVRSCCDMLSPESSGTDILPPILISRYRILYTEQLYGLSVLLSLCGLEGVVALPGPSRIVFSSIQRLLGCSRTLFSSIHRLQGYSRTLFSSIWRLLGGSRTLFQATPQLLGYARTLFPSIQRLLGCSRRSGKLWQAPWTKQILQDVSATLCPGRSTEA